ncbi:MAG: hypothetical protein J2P19_00065 [Pseudonocardia sp.]|nr:hypothetical protein [Pseudonocardia sp.]
MTQSANAAVPSKTVLVTMPKCGRKPHNCPPEVSRSWGRLVATYKSVTELFDTYNVLRTQQPDPRGPISESQRDQARAAIVFTSAGIDASLRTLLRDSLTTLLRTDGRAHGVFTRHLYGERLNGSVTEATKKAVVALDARGALIDLYVADITGASVQGWKDLKKVRDALGIVSDSLVDEHLKTHQDFFDARHQVVHELDLVDPSGKGSRGRRHRDVPEVARQCSRALALVEEFIHQSAQEVRQASRQLDR